MHNPSQTDREAWTQIKSRLNDIYQGGEYVCFGLLNEDDTNELPLLKSASLDELGEDAYQAVDPFRSIYVFHSPAQHWHFITMGLSDFGFELTCRVPLTESEKLPPTWPLRYLRRFGSYVLETNRGFDAGHYIDAAGPILGSRPTALEGFGVANDPSFDTISSAEGKVQLLQIVGLTRDELERVKKTDAKAVLAALASSDPFLLSDYKRGSIMGDAQKLSIIESQEER